MASLQQTLNTLDYKCWYYETALKAGTTDVLQNMPIEDIPEQFQEVRQNLTCLLYTSPSPRDCS